MEHFLRTDSKNPDFVKLVNELDSELSYIDGEEHQFYAQYNTIDKLGHVLIIYRNNKAISCGAFKKIDETTIEVKRMYTIPERRGIGYASQVLKELEHWAREMKFNYSILETGIRQPDAIRLYEKNGYSRIPNYGQYIGVENSVCFGKELC